MEQTSTENREVLPRWRALKMTPPQELAPSNFSNIPNEKHKAVLERLEREFNTSKELQGAAEIVEAAIVLGKSTYSIEAAKIVAADKDATKELKYLASKVLDLEPAPLRQLNPPSSEKIQEKICATKAALSDRPRDGLLALEIARLQFNIGQLNSAQKYAERAVMTYPNNRYVLRSISCMFATSDEAERALYYLRRSDLVKSDPWVQAAEVAVCGQLNKSPQLTKYGIRDIKSSTRINVSMTELTAGLASLEFKSGNKKSAKKLMEQSMLAPNENSLAQLRWFQENREFAKNVFPLNAVPMAYEANAYEAVSEERIGDAVDFSECWLRDQPFQSRAAMLASSLCISVLADRERALNIVNEALICAPDDMGLLNNKLVALSLLGQNHEAEKILLSKISTPQNDEERLPFYHAAFGMVAFGNFDYEKGRNHYTDAIKAAAKAKNPELSLLAMSYWLERELEHKQISYASVQLLIKKVEDKIKKHTRLVKDIKPAWDAFKKRCDALSGFVIQTPLDELYSIADIGLKSLDKSEV